MASTISAISALIGLATGLEAAFLAGGVDGELAIGLVALFVALGVTGAEAVTTVPSPVNTGVGKGKRNDASAPLGPEDNTSEDTVETNPLESTSSVSSTATAAAVLRRGCLLYTSPSPRDS